MYVCVCVCVSAFVRVNPDPDESRYTHTYIHTYGYTLQLERVFRVNPQIRVNPGGFVTAPVTVCLSGGDSG